MKPLDLIEHPESGRFRELGLDEVWNLYQGTGLSLNTWNGTTTQPKRTILSADNNCFCRVVPAGTWQAAEAIADPVLVGCSVAPGFEFADFTLINPDTEDAKHTWLRP